MLRSCLHKTLTEAGCDEAGRGCLAGPVFAAAVILPVDYRNPLLNDSKKLAEKKRLLLREDIERHAISFGVASVSPAEIDEINILNASFLAMHRALDKLLVRPDFLLIDGNRFTPYFEIPHQCVVGGDGKFLSIAAASILAKTYRDDYMQQCDTEYPEYGWKSNKGYPTLSHKLAIKQSGLSPLHRKSFQYNLQLKLKF
ncbi:MAG: ribonuclease HII [bacterium]|jgi:ribonuclease HII